MNLVFIKKSAKLQVSRKYKEKEYEKYWIVEKLKWKKGDELEAEVKGDKLVIKKD